MVSCPGCVFNGGTDEYSNDIAHPLGVNKFHVDEGHPHIILAANPDINEFRKLMKACPAGLYM